MTAKLAASLLIVAALLPAQTPLPYEPVEGWAQMPADYEPDAGMAVAVDGDGAIWYYNRGSHPVIQFSPDGNVLQAWKEDPKLSTHRGAAHGMGVGPDGGLWLVDREAQAVWKFSREGRRLLGLGGFSGMVGDNSAKYAFDRPSSVAFDSAGNVYVGDGYRNTRVVKYDPQGRYIKHWGGPGDGEGEFNLVHGVAVDNRDRVIVADRGNKRIQVFTNDGKFLDQWTNLGIPWAVAWDQKEQAVWVADGDNGKVMKVSPDGKLLGSFGSVGEKPGELSQVHGIAVGNDGALYVSETLNQRIQKFTRK